MTNFGAGATLLDAPARTSPDDQPARTGATGLMSRNYAQIFTAIWRDPDFIALSRPRQQAYFLLVTQPNISAAGVLPLTVRRWTKLSADTTTAELLADIAHLHRVGMVVVDEDTEELLVRSFVRHDNGYRNPRRQPSIRDAATDIESPRLRRVLARELVRLECPGWLPEMTDVDLSAEEQPTTPPPDTFSQVNSHSDSHSDSQTGIDGMANRFQAARTTTHNPQPTTPTSSAADATAADGVLFGVEPTRTPPKPRRAPASEGTFNASHVVAAFHEGANETGRTVTPQITKQVGATAKQIISTGKVPPERLLAAAREMGRQGWKDLNLQLLRGNQPGRMNGGMQSAPTRRLHNSHDNQDRYDIKL